MVFQLIAALVTRRREFIRARPARLDRDREGRNALGSAFRPSRNPSRELRRHLRPERKSWNNRCHTLVCWR